MGTGRTGKGKLLDDDASQTGMRMDEAIVAERDEEMLLRRPRFDQQDVTANYGASDRTQAVLAGEAEPWSDIGIAKSVSAWIAHGPAACCQGRTDQPDAVEPRFAIASEKAEACTFQRLRRTGQSVGCHRGIG